MDIENTPKIVYNKKYPDLTLWELFYGEKFDWYDTKDNKINWDKSLDKIELFWNAVKEEKMKKNDYDFSLFTFPLFTGGCFWEYNSKYEFDSEVSFSNCLFLGKVQLVNIHFKDVVLFYDASFQDSVWIEKIKCNKMIKFSGVEFNQEVKIFNSEFNDKFFIVFCKIYSLLLINSVLYRETDFVFSDWQIDRKILLQDIVFSPSSYFRCCDFSKVDFVRCDVKNAKFDDCKFKTVNNRLVLYNESPKNYLDLASVYRQFKRNFTDAKDWSLAGDAYRSEMVMMRRWIGKEFKEAPLKKFHLSLNWLIRIIFELGSGYQQSFTRPLFLLILLIFLVPLIFIDGCWCEYSTALKVSINAALPIIGKIPESSPYYFILVVERIVSVVLLTFFVLATRIRLRQ